MDSPAATEWISINEGDDLDVASRSLLPFKHLGHLGTGASALVEMVQDQTTGRIFAHKLYRRFRGRDIARFRQEVQNEISIIRRLSENPHIIQVFATYTCGREVGLILSPVADGGDLGNHLQTIQDRGQGPTAEEKVVLERAFGCLASGISFIHKQTIRHKDIKPQNILIHRGSVLYTDFGISLDASQDERTTTMGTALCLTFRYCAP
jgi:serine/threonine protein kinase